MIAKGRIFVVVGTPGSGKDLLIQAINDMGQLHAKIVPKHTSRIRYADDGNEMICSDDPDYDMDGCEVVYKNYASSYGIKLGPIWDTLEDEVFQVIVVSNIDAINELVLVFGSLISIIYVHSEVDPEKFRVEQLKLGKSETYVEQRVLKWRKAFNIYLKNMKRFDHVLIYAESAENLFDQIFRLFTYYENK